MSRLDASPRAEGARWAGWPIVWLIVLLAGVAVWLAYALGWDPPRAWRAMLINFNFFTPLAAGMVTWPAVVMVSRGKWMGPTERLALAGVAFAPVSLIAFIALGSGRAYWAAGMHGEDLPNAAWLSHPLLFTRDAAALVLLWALGLWFVRRRSRPGPCKRLAGWFVFAYCTILTLLGFDTVMALDPHWYSCLFGAYFFVSGMYAAVSAWTLIVLLERPTELKDRLGDLGKLIVAFSLLTTYMMFSQLIVIWYENLPDEVRFVVPRLELKPWVWISAGLLAVVYLGPLVLLLTRASKRSVGYLGGVALAVLVGLWVERWWEVTPTLGGALVIGPAEIALTAAYVAALALAVGQFHRRMPATYPQEVAEA